MDDTPMSPDAEPGEIQEPDDLLSTNIPCYEDHKLEESDTDFDNFQLHKFARHFPSRQVIDLNEKRNYNTPHWDKKYIRSSEILKEFFEMASRGDMNSVYRNRPVWANIPAPAITDAPIRAFNEVPSSRPAVFSFVGLLIHESTHLTFSRRENPHVQTADPHNLDIAATSMIKHFHNTLKTSVGKQLPMDLLAWICSLSADLAQMNYVRLTAGKFQRGPEGLLEMFRQCDSIRKMISLLDATIVRLLELSAEACMAVLFDASRTGVNFNWIWLYIAITFPSSVVSHLFAVGAEHFKIYTDEVLKKERLRTPHESLIPIHEEYNAKLVSLSEVFNFLTRQQNRELRNVVRGMIEKGLACEIVNDECTDLSFCFFFKLITCSVDTLRFLVAFNQDLVTPANVFRAVRQLSLIPKSTLLKNLSYNDFIKQMMFALDITSVGQIFDSLMSIAFDPTIFSAFDKQHPFLCKITKEGALHAADCLISQQLTSLHRAKDHRDCPSVELCANSDRLQMCIEAAVLNPSWSPVLIRYFQCLTVGYGLEKGAEIAARIVCTVWEPQQLTVLCAFLTTITPFYPHLMEKMFATTQKFRNMLDGEWKVKGSRTVDLRWINNIRVLFEWESQANDKNPLKYLGLHAGNSVGPFLIDACGWILNKLEDAVQVSNKQLVADLLFGLCRLLNAIAPCANLISPPIPPGKVRSILLRARPAYKLSYQLAAILRITLSCVEEKGSTPPIDFLAVYADVRSTIFQFLISQLHHLNMQYVNLCVMSFVDGCIQHAVEMFGDQTDYEKWAPPSLEPTEAELEEEEYSFLAHVHELGEQQKAMQMAHSGVIGKGARNGRLPDVKECQHLRRHVFIDSLRTIVTSYGRENSLTTAKSLALLMVERLCGDSVSGDYTFLDWDMEKDSISRYLKVARRLSSSQICEGILYTVAEIDPCLWYALPILKASLADVMILFDSSFDKLVRKPSEAMLQKADRWMFLAGKGGVMPSRFTALSHLLPLCSAHEGLLLLNEIWRYFQKKTGLNVANLMFVAARKGETVRLNDQVRDAQEMMVSMIQRDMAQRGHLLPLIIGDSYGAEETVDEIAEPDDL